MHWDGISWELKRIKTNSCGGVKYPPIKAILAFSPEDILFAHIDGSISHYNGMEFTNDCSLITQLNGSANAIWGISNKDFYVVSNNGFIAHYNGSSWTKIESGTTTDIQDVWGVKIDKDVLVACAVSNIASQGDRKILLYRNGERENIFWPSGLRINSIWFLNLRQMFSCGDGIYKREYGVNWERQIAVENNTFTEKIRGQNVNDVFVVGDFGFAAHYNGFNWKIYEEVNAALFYSMSYKDNVVAAVGERNAKGDRKSTRLNSSHTDISRMPSSA